MFFEAHLHLQLHIKFETPRRSLHRLKLPADVRIKAQPKLHPLHPLHLLDLALYPYFYPYPYPYFYSYPYLYPSLVFALALAQPVAADALQRVQIGLVRVEQSPLAVVHGVYELQLQLNQLIYLEPLQ